ncbi:MAG: MXAN_6577-like cysteine-rich protein [Polyangiales bacterium]
MTAGALLTALLGGCTVGRSVLAPLDDAAADVGAADGGALDAADAVDVTVVPLDTPDAVDMTVVPLDTPDAVDVTVVPLDTPDAVDMTVVPLDTPDVSTGTRRCSDFIACSTSCTDIGCILACATGFTASAQVLFNSLWTCATANCAMTPTFTCVEQRVTSGACDAFVQACMNDGADGGVDAGPADVPPTCGAGQSVCSGVCVNLMTNSANCGSCGNGCPSGRSCVTGACACPLGQSSCGSACVNLSSNTQNCGSCGNACPSGQVCRTGSCQATCASGSTLCGTQCVTTGDDPNNCGGCGNVCPSGNICSSGQCVPVVTIDQIGCADGTREAFVNRTSFPQIAGCSGAWSLPGIFPAIPASTMSQCATLGNSSTTAPANGMGCASSNLCARGWHICNGGEIRTRTMNMGCTATTDYPASSFFAAAVSGTGCFVCALRSNTMTGSACTSLNCAQNCQESGDLNNDFFGCGSYGAPVQAGINCDGLNRVSGNDCVSIPGTWSCGGMTQESRTVTKTGNANGGVLCCRD